MAMAVYSTRMLRAILPLRNGLQASVASMSTSSSSQDPAAIEKKQSPTSWLEVKSSGRVASTESKSELELSDELRSQRPLLYHDQMEWLDDRLVRISKPSKNVMQSGTAYTNTWKIEFNSQERFEYWLMGWTGTADPVSNMSLNFPTKEDAIAFCEKNQLPWYVEEQPERKMRRKSYAENFSWNKRTRTTNK